MILLEYIADKTMLAFMFILVNYDIYKRQGELTNTNYIMGICTAIFIACAIINLIIP